MAAPVSYAALDALIKTLGEDAQHDTHLSEFEALGYARGRMDAAEDHGLPRTVGVDPIDFSRFHAFHVAEHHYRYRQGCATMRRPIRDSWEAYLTR